MFDRALVEYLPPVLREVREYQALTLGKDPEIALLWAGLQAALDDQFIVTATEYGVKRWEAILQITPKASFILEERKFTILTRFAEQLPFTIRMLERILTELCGAGEFTVSLDHNVYTLTVRVELTARNMFNVVESLLHRIVPANMIIDLSLRYIQHETLSQFTHAELTDYTHDEIRNGVFNNV